MSKKTLKLLSALGVILFIAGVILTFNKHLSLGTGLMAVGAMWAIISFGQMRQLNMMSKMH